ncbi:ferritin-like domain-containing protein [Uliginosibacterium sp. H3]|uniref:Ferritin-like domain-containing protein n=1 Tax=Uliginosibacterium silvisoli TaxID=3114758 RepID=A0ABU6JYC8_9RHOO|nr:ferritin-like domain-containing protein [Uliginosibacterium sp. H3]
MLTETKPREIETLRQQAREHIDEGAVTAGYAANRDAVVSRLNEALATELVCVLRYRRHHFMAKGIHSKSVAAEFMEHALQEQGHADEIAARIVQLGGEPQFNPDKLSSLSHADYVECSGLGEMIKENLVAERIAIDSYRNLIQYVGENDPTTRRMLEGILATEEEHAEDMSDLLESVKD